MNLKQGLNVKAQKEQILDNLNINSGVIHHSKTNIAEVKIGGNTFKPKFERTAHLPKNDWRSLEQNEYKVLRSSSKALKNEFNTIYLGELPNSLKNSFDLLNIKDTLTYKEVIDKMQSQPKRVMDLNLSLDKFLNPMAGSKSYKLQCVLTNVPNIETTAHNVFDSVKGHKVEDINYIGIHNDSMRKMSVFTAHKLENRISINIGAEPRYFLFVNLSIIQIYNMLLREAKLPKDEVNLFNLRRLFFEHFPDYPVVRVKLNPYQYYIAPTFNCFHDGATTGNKKLDITIIYFGFFKC